MLLFPVDFKEISFFWHVMVRELVKSIQQYQATTVTWYGYNNYQFKNTNPHRSVVRELVKSIQQYQATTVAWY